MKWTIAAASTLLVLAGELGLPSALRAADGSASVLLISVDTLRADRLSSYGYARNTSPRIDGLLERGVRFSRARTNEPLTAPALASMLTSLSPHDHGSTRNGLRVRPDLPSLPRLLRRHGYRAAAFVGSWTLRDKLWGMSEHFDRFEEVLTKARWLGMVKREATAVDINEQALRWLNEHLAAEPSRPFFLWVHYVEPHAPYVLQRDFLDQIGAPPDGDLYSSQNKYDSEIAFVDFQISALLQGVSERVPVDRTLILFVADHGESLGEHGYWGHGRHLYEPTLHIPMGIVWGGHLQPRVIDAPALITDLAPTVVGLLGLEVPSFFLGLDWTGVLRGRVEEPGDRITLYQAHRGAVTTKEDQTRVRQRGLLEIARIEGSRKEIFRVSNDRRRLFDVVDDPAELASLVPLRSQMSPPLKTWLEQVRQGLVASDELPPPSLSEEDVAALRALGYTD